MKRLFSRDSKSLDLSTQKILYDQFHSLVYRTAYRYCADSHLAMDIVQETFIRAFRYIHTYKEQDNGSFEAWLVTIAKNESLKMITKTAKRNEIFAEDISIYNDIVSESIESGVIAKMSLEEIYTKIQHMPDISRMVLLLRIVHDYSYKEIGELLGIKENTARQRLFRMKKELQQIMSGREGRETDA